jgi:GTP cyclohydrolase I
MSTTSEPIPQGDGNLLKSLSVAGLETEHTSPQVHRPTLEDICKALLVSIGENPDRDALKDTPRRWAKFWSDFIDYDDDNHSTHFVPVTTDQMVVVSGMRVWSLCEHHLLPFWCDISIGYIAEERVLGLSKFARISHLVAHRLQTQENIVHQIALMVKDLTQSEDVAVLGKGVHTCMVMRGIRTEGIMTTSVTHGTFRENPEARDEFLSLVENR